MAIKIQFINSIFAIYFFRYIFKMLEYIKIRIYYYNSLFYIFNLYKLKFILKIIINN